MNDFDNQSGEAGRFARRTWWLVFIVGTVLAFPFAWNLAFGNSLGRDEHQHLAAGIVMLREGWLPYRDYAFFHLPYLPWTYGGLFRLGGDPLEISRLFSAACVALTAGLVGAAGWQLWRGRGAAMAWLAAGCGIAVLLTTPLFTQVAGHTWNLEPSTLFLLAAFVALLEKGERGRWIAAGVFTGIAAGYRITVLPMVLPLMIMAWAQTRSWRSLFSYSLGLSLGMLPLAIAFLYHPAEFVFGNIEFPKLNIDYRYATGEPRTMTLPTKLRAFVKEVMRPNWALLIALPLLLAVLRGVLKIRLRESPALRWLLLALPFLMMGAMAPSPLFDQYFYVLLPFLVLGLIATLRLLPMQRNGALLGAAAVLIFTLSGFFRPDEYESFKRLRQREKWAVTETREEAAKLRARIGDQGRVLTVAPGLVLEAGLEVYPEFITGPFAWRVSPYVAGERRAEFHLASPEELDPLLKAHPPLAILTGFAKKEEKQLVAYAKEHGYRKEKFGKGKTLWLPKDALIQ